VIIASLSLAYYQFLFQTNTITEDKTIDSDFIVKQGKTFTIKNGATLSVLGDLSVQGNIMCENGPLSIDVKGDLSVEGELICDFPSQATAAIQIVAERNVKFGQQAQVKSTGPIRIYDSEQVMLKQNYSLNDTFMLLTKSEPYPNQIGPFVDDSNLLIGIADTSHMNSQQQNFTKKNQFILSGKWTEHVSNITQSLITVELGELTELSVQQLHVDSEKAPDGGSDTLGCDARGEDGKNGLRLLFQAGKIVIDGAQITLPEGGKGGDAKTPIGCTTAKATGGKGGEHGNIVIRSKYGIEIDDLSFDTKKGGDGGNAEAIASGGTTSCPGANGGNASAGGGNAGNSNYHLLIYGSVVGSENIHLGDIVSGDGGDASALAGRGGNGDGCKCAGGSGGTAEAIHGASGKISLAPNAHFLSRAEGKIAAANAIGGAGGDGGDCPYLPKGGDGGTGGSATTSEVTQGEIPDPNTASGTPALVPNERTQSIGGIGGDGGDGCPNGKGGGGGLGTRNGPAGKDGDTKCNQ
jgi:hypothetical protein